MSQPPEIPVRGSNQHVRSPAPTIIVPDRTSSLISSKGKKEKRQLELEQDAINEEIVHAQKRVKRQASFDAT